MHRPLLFLLLALRPLKQPLMGTKQSSQGGNLLFITISVFNYNLYINIVYLILVYEKGRFIGVSVIDCNISST